VALSTAEAEYIAVGSCCAQTLWMKQQLSDFGLNLSKIPLLCDNTSAINLTKNPVQHSRTKHIEIRHHFIRDHVTNGDCEIQFVSTENQLANLFTKPLSKERFNFLRNELVYWISNMCCESFISYVLLAICFFFFFSSWHFTVHCTRFNFIIFFLDKS